MIKSYWCICCDCENVSIAQFSSEMGCLFAVDEYGEECQECGSTDLDVQDEFDGSYMKELEREQDAQIRKEMGA